MLISTYEKKFLKDLKLSAKCGKNMKKLEDVLDRLLEEKPLPPKNHNHKLQGEYGDCWECHVEPDWLLIYRKTTSAIIFVRTGSHSDLF